MPPGAIFSNSMFYTDSFIVFIEILVIAECLHGTKYTCKMLDQQILRVKSGV